MSRIVYSNRFLKELETTDTGLEANDEGIVNAECFRWIQRPQRVAKTQSIQQIQSVQKPQRLERFQRSQRIQRNTQKEERTEDISIFMKSAESTLFGVMLIE